MHYTSSTRRHLLTCLRESLVATIRNVQLHYGADEYKLSCDSQLTTKEVSIIVDGVFITVSSNAETKVIIYKLLTRYEIML